MADESGEPLDEFVYVPRIVGFLIGVIVTVEWAALAALVLWQMPKYIAIFKDFDQALPTLTTIFIEYRIPITAVCGAIGGAAFVLGCVRFKGHVSLLLAMAVLGIPVWFVYHMAMTHALTAVIQSVTR